MASLRDLKRRIVSVKNTRKITKAMKMIAAVRLRKSQEAILSARPYAVKLHEVLSNLALRIDGEKPALLDRGKEVKKIELLIITSDRGLCGGFNSNILRYAERYRRKHAGKYEITISVIGRKGTEYFRARDIPIRKNHLGVFEKLNYMKASEIAEELTNEFLGEAFDRIDLVYNEFKSAVSQDVTHETLLPIQPMGMDDEASEPNFIKSDYDYEPSKEELLNSILPRYFATQIFRVLLESVASEHGARMTAMENATNNATDMIDSLTLQFNRARQAAITTELMEIIGGAEALKA